MTSVNAQRPIHVVLEMSGELIPGAFHPEASLQKTFPDVVLCETRVVPTLSLICGVKSVDALPEHLTAEIAFLDASGATVYRVKDVADVKDDQRKLDRTMEVRGHRLLVVPQYRVTLPQEVVARAATWVIRLDED
jgi:hypothetical protein